jgi:hypothetical protein
MAVYPVQAGHPDYGTGGSSQYIPAVYSALMVKKFYPQTLFGQISNTDYEGDIKEMGDTVYIRTRPTIETFRYKKGMVLPVQNPESPYVDLKIDQGEGFSFALDRVDEFQSDINLMSDWGDDASAQMKQVLDRNMLTSISAAGAIAAGKAGTTVSGYDAAANASFAGYTIAKGAVVAGGTTTRGTSIAAGTVAGSSLGLSDAAVSANTSQKIIDQILFYGRLLDENNAPEADRFVVLPFWAMQALKNIGSQFAQVYASGQDKSPLLTGNVPGIDRFTIYGSNNTPRSTQAVDDPTAIIFGCKYATTFATQITESRIIDNPFAFGKMMQGLQVYGMNIIKPSLIGVDFIKNVA